MSDQDSAVAREMHAAFLQVAPDFHVTYQSWDELPEMERRLAVRAMWQALHTCDFLTAMMAELEDLEPIRQAWLREKTIRATMAETGESREIVIEAVGALESMGQEAVLNLTDGEPTTLRDALERYVGYQRSQLNDDPNDEEAGTRREVVESLAALLRYPWLGAPAPELEIDDSGDEEIIIKVGGVEVARANHDDHGWAGMRLAQEVAGAVLNQVNRVKL